MGKTGSDRSPNNPRGNTHESEETQKVDLKTYLNEYCEYSSIPGVKYLAEDRPFFEKLLWTLGLILAILACIYLIAEAWDLKNTNPVLLAKEKKQTPVWEIPFPAITICPFQKIKKINGSEKDLQCAYNMLCGRNMACDVNNIISFLEEFGLNTSDILPLGNIYLNFKKQEVKPVLTNDGICYSFNMVPGSKLFADDTFHRKKSYLDFPDVFQWSEDKGYLSKQFEDVYPRRALPGPEAGMLIILQVAKDLEEDNIDIVKPCTHLRGFQIKVHNPFDIPNGDIANYITAPSNARITVHPQQLTSDDLGSYPPRERQCYYPEDKKLEFFKIYTQRNCEEECLAKVSLDCCHCVGFYMPRKQTTPVCITEDDAICLIEAKNKVRLEGSHLTYGGYCNTSKISCGDCLPNCASMKYESQVSQSHLDLKRFSQVLSYQNVKLHPESYDYIALEIFYTDSHLFPYKRIEVSSTIDFISNIGGLLGLCLGFCAMSLVEFIYWLVMRPILCLRPTLRTDVLKEDEMEMQELTPHSSGHHSKDTQLSKPE